MKIRPNYEAGGTSLIWLILIIIWICVIIGLGLILYNAIKKVKLPKLPEGEDYSMLISNETASATSSFLSAHPDATIVSTTVQVSYGFEPFPTPTAATLVYRSTNLLNWDLVATVQPEEQWIDTNLFPQAFYYTVQADGQPALADTNFVPQFIVK